jgi:hypothetical protein
MDRVAYRALMQPYLVADLPQPNQTVSTQQQARRMSRVGISLLSVPYHARQRRQFVTIRATYHYKNQ